MELQIHPVTAERWPDMEALFGPRGACAGCWCMFFRQTQKEFEALRGDGNRAAMKALIDGGQVPGLIAYAGDKPVGWVSVAPRSEFPRLQRSRLFKPIDDRPVWSVVCFFVAPGYRRKGVTVALLKAAVDYVRERGGQVVEGYPVEPESGYPDAYAYVGLTAAFRKAGFAEVAQPSAKRRIMRCEL
jgi:GNAT superfamily N-acetyltransferase